MSMERFIEMATQLPEEKPREVMSDIISGTNKRRTFCGNSKLYSSLCDIDMIASPRYDLALHKSREIREVHVNYK